MTWNTNPYQPQPMQDTNEDIPSLGNLINGAGGKAFFNQNTQPGATVSGVIEKVETRRKLNYQTKQPEVSKKGRPKYEVVITIATTLHEDMDDDGRRNIYINLWGVQQDALRDACRAAGVKEPHEGDTFTATFTGLGQPFAPGMSAPKLYQYRIEKAGNPILAQAMSEPTQQQHPAQMQQPQQPMQQQPTLDPIQVTGLRNMGKTDQEIAAMLNVPVQMVNAIPGQTRTMGSENTDGFGSGPVQVGSDAGDDF